MPPYYGIARLQHMRYVGWRHCTVLNQHHLEKVLAQPNDSLYFVGADSARQNREVVQHGRAKVGLVASFRIWPESPAVFPWSPSTNGL
ncbi:hypothetical protein MRX96_013222 [Rhipicephalus microplus]